MRKFKDGDLVQLKPDFYKSQWFKDHDRHDRKALATLIGQIGKASLEHALSSVFQLYTVRFGYMTVLHIPVILLEPVHTERLTKRPAKVGEKIKIVNATATMDLYKNGDVLIVKKPACFDDGVYVEEFFHVILDCEYLVIESAEPEKHHYTEEQIAEARQITYDELFKVWNPKGNTESIQMAAFNPNQTGRHQDEDDEPYADKPRTVCTRRYTYDAAIVQRTYAFCSPNDEWTPEIGRMVAICKMTGRKLPEWL